MEEIVSNGGLKRVASILRGPVADRFDTADGYPTVALGTRGIAGF